MVTVFTCFSSASVFFGGVLDGAAVKRLGVPQPHGIFARKAALSLLAVHVLE